MWFSFNSSKFLYSSSLFFIIFSFILLFIRIMEGAINCSFYLIVLIQTWSLERDCLSEIQLRLYLRDCIVLVAWSNSLFSPFCPFFTSPKVLIFFFLLFCVRSYYCLLLVLMKCSNLWLWALFIHCLRHFNALLWQ